jgi:hypothetical protein
MNFSQTVDTLCRLPNSKPHVVSTIVGFQIPSHNFSPTVYTYNHVGVCTHSSAAETNDRRVDGARLFILERGWHGGTKW